MRQRHISEEAGAEVTRVRKMLRNDRLLIKRELRRSVMQRSTGEHLQSLSARRTILKALQL